MLLQQPSRSCRLANKIDFWCSGKRPFDAWQVFIPKMMPYHKMMSYHLSHRWSLQLFTTIRRCHQQSALALLLEKLSFQQHQHSTRGRQQGDFRPFQPRHWLVISHSQTEHLSCGTCLPGRCKPPVPCQFSRKTFYHSLTLLHPARTFYRFVLETLPSNYFSSFLSILFLPFCVGPL